MDLRFIRMNMLTTQDQTTTLRRGGGGEGIDKRRGGEGGGVLNSNFPGFPFIDWKQSRAMLMPRSHCHENPKANQKKKLF